MIYLPKGARERQTEGESKSSATKDDAMQSGGGRQGSAGSCGIVGMVSLLYPRRA